MRDPSSPGSDGARTPPAAVDSGYCLMPSPRKPGGTAGAAGGTRSSIEAVGAVFATVFPPQAPAAATTTRHLLGRPRDVEGRVGGLDVVAHGLRGLVRLREGGGELPAHPLGLDVVPVRLALGAEVDPALLHLVRRLRGGLDPGELAGEDAGRRRVVEDEGRRAGRRRGAGQDARRRGRGRGLGERHGAGEAEPESDHENRRDT